MKPFTYIKSNASALKPLKHAYLNRTSAPLDGMWETFVEMADHYVVHLQENPIGYFAVNAERKLMQFHLPIQSGKREFFDHLIKEMCLTGAFVSTAEADYLSLCLDVQKHVKVNALMYHTDDNIALPDAVFPPACEFRLVARTEHETAVNFGVAAIGAEEGWLRNYYQNHINSEQLYGLWHKNTIIAAGELRHSASQKPYADVGMVVSQDYRGKGIATNVLLKLRRLARENGLRAICSTEQSNIAAQRAISNAGFISQHRVLDISF